MIQKAILLAVLFCSASNLSCQTKMNAVQTNKHQISEAKIMLQLPKDWELFSKTGKLEHGKVQYSFSHPQVQGAGRLVNPSITITVDKASWFTDEKNYLEEKLGFHKTMGDVIKKTYAPSDKKNPLQLKNAYYSEATCGEKDHPYGQHYIFITFWNEKAGFYMEIQTSEKDLKTNKKQYDAILKSITKI